MPGPPVMRLPRGRSCRSIPCRRQSPDDRLQRRRCQGHGIGRAEHRAFQWAARPQLCPPELRHRRRSQRDETRRRRIDLQPMTKTSFAELPHTPPRTSLTPEASGFQLAPVVVEADDRPAVSDCEGLARRAAPHTEERGSCPRGHRLPGRPVVAEDSPAPADGEDAARRAAPHGELLPVPLIPTAQGPTLRGAGRAVRTAVRQDRPGSRDAVAAFNVAADPCPAGRLSAPLRGTRGWAAPGPPARQAEEVPES